MKATFFFFNKSKDFASLGNIASYQDIEKDKPNHLYVEEHGHNFLICAKDEELHPVPLQTTTEMSSSEISN